MLLSMGCGCRKLDSAILVMKSAEGSDVTVRFSWKCQRSAVVGASHASGDCGAGQAGPHFFRMGRHGADGCDCCRTALVLVRLNRFGSYVTNTVRVRRCATVREMKEGPSSSAIRY